MSYRIDELQKRIEHLETEVELLKELVKLQNKCPERVIPTYPLTPLQPYYTKEPTLEPPYKFTSGGAIYLGDMELNDKWKTQLFGGEE